jgi:uncharacterized protein YndB with AHSA1/START domain
VSDITQEITIEATPKSVFNAVALPEGITQWWANHVTGELQMGSIIEIRFDNGEVMKMEITELEIDRKLHWKVRSAPHNWEGSTITWETTPIQNGTRLLFGHHDLTLGKAGYSVDQTRAGWEYFLESLKSYLEAGEGTPYRH